METCLVRVLQPLNCFRHQRCCTEPMEDVPNGCGSRRERKRCGERHGQERRSQNDNTAVVSSIQQSITSVSPLLFVLHTTSLPTVRLRADGDIQPEAPGGRKSTINR